GLGWAAEAFVRRVPSQQRSTATGLVVVIAVAQVMTLPSLSWGNLGGWRLSDYTDEWAEVASLVAEESGSSTATTVVVPFEVYRRFEWNDQRAWLDPAPRILPGRVIVDDTLTLGEGERVQGESEAARRIRTAGSSWAALD